jgi:outer membrane protein assembly factor BamD (BamD/ComL family)
MERYQDFVIRISPAGQDSFRVEASSPLGEASTTFTLPFDEKDLKIFMLEVGRPRSAASRGRIPDFMRPTVDFGHSLYKSVIHNDVRDLFIRSLHTAEQSNEGLRIRLRLNEAPALSHLPWEFLYDGRDFLALSDASPLVRYLDLPNPPRRLAVDLPLRILVTISAPRDLPVLDVELEKSKIEQALSRLVTEGLVRLEYTENASLNTLQGVLRRAKAAGEPYHVWHYIGHGAFDPDQQASMLAMTNAQGMLQMVSGFELGTLLQNFSELRLALLNACEGARSGSEDPFAGVSTALVEYGIPAVIAMQFEISDQAAITFASEFYAALVDGLGLDTAVTNARRTVFFMPNYVEWATPVLYLRSPESRIFDIARPARATQVQPVQPELDTQARQDEAQRLLSHYVRGLSDFYLERWAGAISHLQAVVSVQADYEDAAEKLADARNKHELATLYRQGQSSMKAGAWDEAIESLQQLQAKEPDYQDSAALLAEARKCKQLSDLYDQAGLLFQADQWQAVLTVFDRLDEIDPQFADTKNYRQQARQNHARQEQERKLRELYARALLKIKEADFAAAQEALEQVQGIDPAYEDAAALLEKVGQERQRRDRERSLQELYTAALLKIKDADFPAAQEALARVMGIDPNYEDAPALLDKVKQERLQQVEKQQQAQRDAEQLRQMEGLYKQAQTAVRRKDWQKAYSLLEQVRSIQPGYKDTQDLLARVTQALEAQVTGQAAAIEEKGSPPQTEEVQAPANIFKGPIPLLPWVGLHVLGWAGLAVGNIGDGLNFLFLGVLVLVIAGTQWFFLRKNLPSGAARWGMLTALGILIGLFSLFPILALLDSLGVYIEVFSPVGIGVTVSFFGAIAAWVQTRLLPAEAKGRRLWISASLAQGLAWFLLLDLSFNYGFGYYVPELMNIAILVGLFHGAATGLVLNWILAATIASPIQKESAQIKDDMPAPTGIISRLEPGAGELSTGKSVKRVADALFASRLWKEPIPMPGWLGVHALGWVVLSLAPLEDQEMSLIVFVTACLILAAGQWFLLRKVLSKAAVRWGILSGLAFLIGGFITARILFSSWPPIHVTAGLGGAVMAVMGGIAGFLQSRFLTVDSKKRNAWISVSLFLGVAWVLFTSTYLKYGYYQFSVIVLQSALLAGVFHGAASGLILNSILGVNSAGPGLPAVGQERGNAPVASPGGLLERMVSIYLDKDLWKAPIPMTRWVGLHVLGWFILSFTVLTSNFMVLFPIAGMVLFTSAVEWFYLRKHLIRGAARWAIMNGTGIISGFFLGILFALGVAYVLENIFSMYVSTMVGSLVIACGFTIMGGVMGLLQSRFLPKSQKNKNYWISAALGQGVAWFVVFVILIDHMGVYTILTVLSTLLAGLIHGAATGLPLNSILADQTSLNE